MDSTLLKGYPWADQGCGTDSQTAERPRAAADLLSMHRHACIQPGCLALQDATRLKSENDALHKLSEDAVLDQQLKKALQETDKLKAAADAYKKDLLQQKLSDKEWELQQAREQMADVEKENSGQAHVRGACPPPGASPMFRHAQGTQEQMADVEKENSGQVLSVPHVQRPQVW